MTEPTPEPTPTAPEPAQVPAPAEPDWKAEARKWETRAKENMTQLTALKPKADQFDVLEQASKSEMQRKDEAAAQAQQERDEARAEALRLRVAMKHGIPNDDLDLLGSGSEDEIEARAARIAALHAQTKPADPPPGSKSVPDLKPGAVPNTPVDVDSVEARYKKFFSPTS